MMKPYIGHARNAKVRSPYRHHRRVNHRKFWRQATVGLASLGILLAVLLTQVHFSINLTQSLPYKVFICVHGIAPRTGDFVSIQNHPTKYFCDIHYTKRLRGLPGDQIHIHRNQVYIESPGIGNKIIGRLRNTTKDGKPLHALEAKIIPEGYVFVSADHPHSFDSRYAEFGLVKKENIWGRCFGISRCAHKSDLNQEDAR